jgi:nitrite reductase/ring-hydroxylating ferredoxin subunit
VRTDIGVRAYLNRCPHRGTPLNWVPNRFLTDDREHAICATHGALFRIDDGRCIAGPCAGDSLVPVRVEVDGDIVVIPEGALLTVGEQRLLRSRARSTTFRPASGPQSRECNAPCR